MASERGFLLVADITGYTAYLSGSELEHAQGTLRALLELIIDHTRPPLTISRLEGDAVISYALDASQLHGQTLIEINEQTYVAFRRAIERMVMNNTCRCNACANVGALDLKFFVHYGTFVRQRLGGHDELVGTDVNIVHRLLKNRVPEKTGARAYTLYTEAALDAMQMESVREHLVEHAEHVDGIGTVRCWVQDMAPVWTRLRDVSAITLPEDRLLGAVETEIAMSPHQLWDYLMTPEARATLLGADGHEARRLEHGRIAQGTEFQCVHGDQVIPQTVIEWRPFERIVLDTLIPVPIRNVYALTEYLLSPTDKGTRFTQRMGKARGPMLGRWLCDVTMRRMLARRGQKDLDRFRDYVERDLAGRGGVDRGSGSPGDSPDMAAPAGTSTPHRH
jgi:uncharacterized protein YndB with AHSA1/START domain